MNRLLKFSEWVSVRESAVAGAVGPGTVTPGQQQAQDMTAQAIQKMPLKPGQNVADLLKDPKQQSKLLDQANKVAKQKGQPLNLGAAATAMDPNQVAAQVGT